MFGCQVGSEIITPDADGGEISDFTCVLSSEIVDFSHAYDYEPYALNVQVGEEAVLVDLTDAPWVEIKDDVELIYPDSNIDLQIVPVEPNYSQVARTGTIVLRGKYTGQFKEVTVTQVGSFQDSAESKDNVWSLTSDYVSSETWLTGGLLTANQGDMNGLLTLERSVNSPVEILPDEDRGTFKGFDIGDAILLRAPVKNLEPETALTAMLNLSQKSSGVECEWVAEYWDAGGWNSYATYKTSRAEEDFTYKPLTCEFTLKESIVNDYVKVRFRKLSGSGIVTNFIAADPKIGAELKVVGVPKKPIDITFDFSKSWPFSPDLPKGSTSALQKTKDAYTFIYEGVTYPVEIYAPTSGYYWTGSALRFQSTGGGYLMTPAIEGRTLIGVTVTITNSSGSKKIYVSTDGTEAAAIAEVSPSSSSKTMGVTFTGALENTPYYLYTKATNTQIAQIVLTYK